MKSLNNLEVRNSCLRSHSCYFLLIVLIFFINSCTGLPKSYSLLEFAGMDEINNLSKSYLLMLNESDSINPAVVMGSKGDLFWCDDYLFVHDKPFAKNRFLFKSTDSILYVNDKIYSINIPIKDDSIPWFKNPKEYDFSTLQFINVQSKFPDSYLPYLAKLAEIKPNPGIYLPGDFKDMAELLKIFNPRIIAGTSLVRSNYAQLSRLTNLEILMITLNDSIITDPLPFMPALKQLFLTDLKDDVVVTKNFLINNKQIERLIIQTSGSLDISILNPLNSLKELVINVSDEIKNLDLINNHMNLEVLSVAGDALIYDPNVIKLPLLRWMAFSSNVTQEEFNSFIGRHPDLEVIELIKNDTIRSFQALSNLRMLHGLVINDTVADIATIKTLGGLKYLSLPHDFLADSVNKSEIKRSLPGTRIVANEGFCLGSGWLLLLLPMILIFRFIGSRLRNGIKS
jgi:hypothetical protein